MRRNARQAETVAPPIREAETPAVPKEVTAPPSKQSPIVPKLYPRFPPPAEDDGFEYFQDTPTKQRPQTRGKRPPPVEEDIYDWEDSDEAGEVEYKKSIIRKMSPTKRPHFEIEGYGSMDDGELSPHMSPPFKKPNLSDPFTTPPRQVMSTPHTPPDTRVVGNTSRTSNLLPLSYSLLHQLSGHTSTIGGPLWQSLREHLLRCGRVADGAVKGRDAARAANRKKDILIDELERRIRILESEREVDKAVIGALKRNVDVLTGKVRRTD